MSISTSSCINGYCSFIPSYSHLKHNHKLKHNNLRSSKTTRLVLQHNQKITSLRTNAIAESLILSATPPAKSGDITVFLETSAVLFFMYWITNFMVPDLISKYFEFDKVNDDQNQKSNDKR